MLLVLIILMSTRNIGFYEDLTKNIFQLSSNAHLISPSANHIFGFPALHLKCLICSRTHKEDPYLVQKNFVISLLNEPRHE